MKWMWWFWFFFFTVCIIIDVSLGVAEKFGSIYVESLLHMLTILKNLV